MAWPEDYPLKPRDGESKIATRVSRLERDRVSSSGKDSDDKPAPAGRVRHDPSGRAIWEWAAESGRHALDSTSRLLKRLDLPGLSLADENKKPEDTPETGDGTHDGDSSSPTSGAPRAADRAAHTRRSFNPYDTPTPLNRAASRPAPKPVARVIQPVKKRGILARLFGRK
jgi:hypothetical protein